MTVTVKIAKWGHSLGLRLPSAMAKRHRLGEGTAVTIDDRNGTLTLRARRRPRLRDLVGEITPKNRVTSVNWGPPVGREVW